ncbi:GNAT family N-acetyltransferase [bacterium]|nr:GNAT family N-acetyltransferase [bacterium]
MKITSATDGDRTAILELHRASIRGLCAPSYSDEEIAAWTDPLLPERYPVNVPDRPMLVAKDERDGRLLGFSIGGDCEVLALYIHPGEIGRGVGRRLLESMEEFVCRPDCRQLELKATLNAVSFYEKHGYRVGERVWHEL